MRVNGLDSQTCLECHGILSNATIPSTFAVGGIGGIAASAFPGITEFDLADLDANEIADINGRTINPPFLFGSGGVELVGQEMTIDLQRMRSFAEANPNTTVNLVTKGVSFGTLSHDGTDFDTSGVEGIDDDLVVRPFGRKGEFSTIRQFDIGAMEFHHGMQTEEAFGTGVDADGDGVVDEIKIGEISALHIFSTNLERPIAVDTTNPSVVAGRQVFDTIGCADCHTPSLETTSEILRYAFPEVATQPKANTYLSTNLTRQSRFRENTVGGVTVEMFSDLKRHDMGPELAETNGSPLAAQFITPRLWGIGDTAPYLHDGRALTLREAIIMHGGEGLAAANNFNLLSSAEQSDLLLFLDSLRVPEKPAADISQPERK